MYLIAALLMAFGVGVQGQDPPKAVLVDEFGRITWEDYVARVDNLLGRLQDDPNASAYIIFQNSDVKDNRQRFDYLWWAKDHLKLRSFDSSRINLIRAADGGTNKIQIWFVPSGAEKPRYVEVDWSLEVPRETKPFVWTTTEWNSGLITPAEYLSLDFFSSVLAANPAARANFVIRAKSTRQHLREKSKIRDIVVRKYKINQNRIRFFFAFENKIHWDYPQTEVWLVP